MILNKTITTSWKPILEKMFQEDYFFQIEAFLTNEKKNGNIVFPAEDAVFNAFNACDFEDIKVVIIGQDPYHNVGQAHGLSFSVPLGVKVPPSLQNIFKEMQQDLAIPIPKNGNLTPWAEQGVFLLNAILTVNAHQAASHKNAGWTLFTDEVIRTLSNKAENLVFLLWGDFAQKKHVLIDNNKHLVLIATHPSPLSAHGGFFGCKHFSKTNDYLIKHNKKPLNWLLPNAQISLF